MEARKVGEVVSIVSVQCSTVEAGEVYKDRFSLDSLEVVQCPACVGYGRRPVGKKVPQNYVPCDLCNGHGELYKLPKGA